MSASSLPGGGGVRLAFDVLGRSTFSLSFNSSSATAAASAREELPGGLNVGVEGWAGEEIALGLLFGCFGGRGGKRGPLTGGKGFRPRVERRGVSDSQLLRLPVSRCDATAVDDCWRGYATAHYACLLAAKKLTSSRRSPVCHTDAQM